MKTKVLVLLFVFLPSLILACGCDMLITYQGIMPSDYNGNIGFNMRQRFFKGAASTHNHADGSAHEHGQTNQLLSNYELNYRFFVTRKLIINGNIPMAEFKISSSKFNSNYRNVGIGDPYVILKYEVISPTRKNDIKTKQRLLLGAGAKLPIGNNYKAIVNNQPIDEDLLQMQLGNGSIDLILDAIIN